MSASISIKKYLLTRFSLFGILVVLIWGLILKSSYEFAQDDTTEHYLFYDAELADNQQLELPISDDFKLITRHKNDLPGWVIEKMDAQLLPHNQSHYFNIENEHIYVLSYIRTTDASPIYVLHYFEDETSAFFSWLNVGISLLIAMLLIAIFSTHRTLKTQIDTLHKFINPYFKRAQEQLKFMEFQTFANTLTQSRQAEKEAQIQQRLVSAFLSHEVNTPITQINHALSRINQLDDIPLDALPVLDQLAKANTTLLETSRAILALQQIHNEELERLNVVDEFKELANNSAFSDLTLSLKTATSPKVMSHKYLLKLLFTQILKNALQHSQTNELGEQVLYVEVNDQGMQFSNVINSHSTHLGHGLGMSLIQQICHKMDWCCLSKQEDGLFTLTINYTKNLRVTSKP